MLIGMTVKSFSSRYSNEYVNHLQSNVLLERVFHGRRQLEMVHFRNGSCLVAVMFTVCSGQLRKQNSNDVIHSVAHNNYIQLNCENLARCQRFQLSSSKSMSPKSKQW